ncbi:MAG TPA: protein kinase [Vicinamibacterales bacterium]|jgi:serine/threonine protein kinase|nr:protein kinase [Vicinamibacterales bacterium]
MTAPPQPDPADREPPAGGRPSPIGPGTTVNARYLIERELGRGGIGVVYLARDLRLHDMPVVLKCLLDDSTQNAWLSRKFLQEAEALTRIHHPGVVRVIDRDRTADGRSFFVMEFVKGVSLRSAIRPAGLDLEFAAAIVREVGQALSAAHVEGVLHRDLKPENIMLETLSNGGQHAKLIDFGIAKVRDSQDAVSTELGMLAGSLHYMAPEQFLGAPASVASDIYAFAAIAYELLTGRRPFNPDAPNDIAAIAQLMTLQRNGQVVPPQQLRPSVSEEAQAIVLRGLAFDPAARLTEARQFGDALAQALLGGGELTRSAVTLRASIASEASATAPARPRPDGAPIRPAAGEGLPSPAALPPAPQPPSRRRGWLVAGVATVALGVVLSLVYLPRTSRSPEVPLALQEVTTPERSPLGAERTLTYSMTLQRPGGKESPVIGDQVFSAEDRVRLSFTSAQSGHLYIFNEGPPQTPGRRNVNVLFPSVTSNDGSAELHADHTVAIPEGPNGFVFDKEKGVEKVWIVWSRDAQPGLDVLKRWTTGTYGGEIQDAADVRAFDTFLKEHASPTPDVALDDTATTLKARAAVFVKLVELKHQ